MNAYEYPLKMSQEEFEAWAPTITDRWEWVRGYAFPAPHGFAGGTWAHATVASVLFGKLSAGLQRPCRAIVGDLMRLKTPTSQRYGDILIVCEPVHRRATVLDRPAAIIEIVSGDSSERDLMEKREEYLRIPSLEAYYAFFEDEMRALVYLPGSESPTEYREHINVHGVQIALADLFEDLN